MSTVTVPVRVDPANLGALERGVHVSFVRFAVGVDGVYEIELQGEGAPPVPDVHADPAVPVADNHHQRQRS